VLAHFAQQQRRDQKAAQREEQVDTHRTLAEHAWQQARRAVVPNHGQDGQATQPVEPA
jgi:hypothetical protein